MGERLAAPATGSFRRWKPFLRSGESALRLSVQTGAWLSLARALRSGRRGRRFKSCRPDHISQAERRTYGVPALRQCGRPARGIRSIDRISRDLSKEVVACRRTEGSPSTGSTRRPAAPWSRSTAATSTSARSRARRAGRSTTGSSGSGSTAAGSSASPRTTAPPLARRSPRSCSGTGSTRSSTTGRTAARTQRRAASVGSDRAAADYFDGVRSSIARASANDLAWSRLIRSAVISPFVPRSVQYWPSSLVASASAVLSIRPP